MDIKLDYSLQTIEERNEKVKEIIANTPPEELTVTYLDRLSDYIIDICVKEEKAKGNKHAILTKNRLNATINKRETSFEGLIGKLENGEDGIYGMIINDKNVIMTPKIRITEKDIAEIPPLKSLRDEIVKLEANLKNLSGAERAAAHRQLIQMRQDQYVILNAYRKPIYCSNIIRSITKLNLDENITVTEEGDVVSDGIINLFNPKHINIILNNYNSIKLDTERRIDCDMRYLLWWFDNILYGKFAPQYPLLFRLIELKFGGHTNAEIQSIIKAEFGIEHTTVYLSKLWCDKIPSLLVDEFKKDYLDWYYTYAEAGVWKRCSRCGEIKLGHSYYFSRNKTSKDGWYSICKECRSTKRKEDN